jgi:hypothetical protein
MHGGLVCLCVLVNSGVHGVSVMLRGLVCIVCLVCLVCHPMPPPRLRKLQTLSEAPGSTKEICEMVENRCP